MDSLMVELERSINSLKLTLMKDHPVRSTMRYQDPDALRSQLCHQIETLAEDLIKELSLGNTPTLKVPVFFHPHRDLFYQDVQIMGKQKKVDRLIQRISYLLGVPQWLFNVHITSKGLVYGPLVIVTRHQVQNCFIKPGTLIPQDLLNVQVASTAKYVLLVEKDAVFQKLIDADFPSRNGPCILITGKGIPDVNTRYLLKSIWEQLSLPVLGLFDADPYGIEIMSVYRFGSKAMNHLESELSLPSLRWLGVHPTDLKKFSIVTLPLTINDKRKLFSLIKRPYIKDNPQLLGQVEEMLESGLKAEIEGFYQISLKFLTKVYLPMKITLEMYY